MPDVENKSEKKLPEANFEVSSLSDVKDENGNGIFHMRTKTKFIVFISIFIMLAAGALIFLSIENYFAAEIWQTAIWGLCGVLAIYSMFARSILALLLNLILFLGVSLIPVWQTGHETFKPVIEKFTSQPAEEQKTESVAPQVEVPQIEPPRIEQPKNETSAEVEKIETPSVEESNTLTEEKISESAQSENNKLPARENTLRQDLPSI